MPEKVSKTESRRDDGVELETQFILRMPKEPAKVLREAVQIGANNLKDRMSIRLDNDIRYGEVRFDHWLLHAKVVDLPSVIESLKTIDLKSFYKTADVCQMMICKEEPDQPSAEDESPNKNKKKDPNKVDKKYLWPHGITPPCKNVRKRRFRKTLKKKCVEAPEIEKEVKRLLRVDNEAVNVKFELINEEEDPNKSHSDDKAAPTKGKGKKNAKDREAATTSSSQAAHKSRRDVGEHDIFGGEVSDSDEEDNTMNQMDIDDTSRISAEDSRLSDSNSFQGQHGHSSGRMATEFSKSMFNSPRSRKSSGMEPPHTPLSRGTGGFYGESRADSDNEQDFTMSRENINARILDLNRQLNDLKGQRIQKEQEISVIENQTLRQRLQDNLENVLSQILEKEMEIHELQLML